MNIGGLLVDKWEKMRLFGEKTWWENIMDNVLVIGNGFDIGHGYPTSYKEYDDMAQSFESIYNSPWWRSVGGLANIEKPKYYYLDNFMYVEEKLCEEFHSLITDNPELFMKP